MVEARLSHSSHAIEPATKETFFHHDNPNSLPSTVYILYQHPQQPPAGHPHCPPENHFLLLIPYVLTLSETPHPTSHIPFLHPQLAPTSSAFVPSLGQKPHSLIRMSLSYGP